MHRPLRLLSVLVAGALAGPVAAQSLPVDPFFAEAAELLEQGDTIAAFDAMQDRPEVERDLIEWMYLRETDDPLPLATYTTFLDRRSDWPGTDRIRAAAERQMDETIAPDAVLTFFDGAEVQTGEGAVAYARALIASGRAAEAETMLVDVWRANALTDSGHRAIVDAFPDIIASHHAARADAMLWRWRTSDAANQLPLLDEGQQALVRARIALIDRAGDAAEREALVPDRLKSDAGLHYDRFNWFADRGDWTLAANVLLERSTSPEALGVPWRWGSWRRTLARWQMREGNIPEAYALASNHFIAPDETNYSDLEWLSGYIALTYDKDFDRALRHFRNFDASVASPISKGRAGYWLGRAHEGLGDADAAIAAFQAGAEHQTSFYGLLSAEKLGLTLDPDIAGGEDFGDWRTAPVLRNDLVQAGLALLDADERGLAVLFFRDAATGLTRRQIGQLGQMLMDLDEPFYAILTAKSAVAAGTLVQDVYFPVHPMAELDLPVEPALALAIARQESEFRVDAGSGVGALGLMQLMPATAEEVAGWIDAPFSRSRLTTDWEYNARLGAEYLAYLERDFGNSPVMIAAGYNAGPSRPKRWMTDAGDPRVGFGNADPVDVIDWIEHIPFRETRNYVMRVTEGIPVYRARLTGQIGPVRFTDILVGEQPVIRPVPRALPVETRTQVQPPQPTPTRPVARTTQTDRAPDGPAEPAAPQPVRPVSRAGE